MSEYVVGRLIGDIKVKVPGSKSITNRALLIAALGNGLSVLRGTLSSDDSVHFINSLVSLGYNIEVAGDVINIVGMGGEIPKKKATIDVGSAGTAARFLTAMLAMSDGEYVVNASPQMQKRPMEELLVALEQLGAEFSFLNEPYSLPFVVKGRKCGKYISKSEYEISLNIDKSSQYLSALLMTAPMLDGKLTITLTGTRKARSYVGITTNMMKDFGVLVTMLSEDVYVVDGGNYIAKEYMCEPDVSAACYYYGAAAITGKTAIVENVYRTSMQGDIRFLDILEQMGCKVYDTSQGVAVEGPDKLKGISVNMSDCSDQTMTLAAIAPFASEDVIIEGVEHIRRQESDRLSAISDALDRMNIVHEQNDDGIRITPGEPSPCHINTFEDHRMAMAFALTGLMSDGIIIDNPECCKKTFPEYFNILDSITT